MDKLVKHAIRMLEIVEGENDFFRNDEKRQADIARAVYDTILRVQVLERKADRNSSEKPNKSEIPTGSTISKMEQVEDEPQMNPCDGCVCDDGKHLMYCMNCKGIAWKTEPPKVEDVPKAGMSDMSEIDKMIKMVDGILGDDDLCEGCEYVIEGLSCDECRRKYADKIIKILRNVKRKPQTERSE